MCLLSLSHSTFVSRTLVIGLTGGAPKAQSNFILPRFLLSPKPSLKIEVRGSLFSHYGQIGLRGVHENG